MSYDAEKDGLIRAAEAIADGASGVLVRSGDKVVVYGTKAQCESLLAERGNDERWECVLNYGE